MIPRRIKVSPVARRWTGKQIAAETGVSPATVYG
jgi:hypothetical protein